MFTRVLAAGLVCLALTHPSQAVDFSGVRCEAPQMVDIISQKLRHVTVDHSRALTSYGAYIDSVGKVSTVVASSKRLVCGAMLSVSFQGRSTSLRAHITFQTRKDGKVNTWVSIN